MVNKVIQSFPFYSVFKVRLKEYLRKKQSADYYKKNEINNPGDYFSKNCFDYYKCIFIHIPKSAGISINKSLFGNLGGGHASIDWYIRKYGASTVKQYFKFTFVRNPWDRLYSAFYFLQQGGINEEDKAFYNNHLKHISTFELFVMEWLTPEKLQAYWHFMPQYQFITAKQNREKILVDFVGRYERLEDDFAYLAKKLNLQNKNLLKVNSSQGKKNNYREAYTNEMVEKVSILYAEDIKFFNYHF